MVRDAIIAPESPCDEGSGWAVDAHVDRVFDGDGFLARLKDPLGRWNKRVSARFAFIDAPEASQPCADESRDFLATLIAGKELRLIPIFKGSSELPIDGYRRLLCMAYLQEEMPIGPVAYYLDGKSGAGLVRRARAVTRNIELEMVINGWAWVLRQYDYACKQQYLAAEQDARHNQRGIWATSKPEPPWSFKARQRRRRVIMALQPSLLP